MNATTLLALLGLLIIASVANANWSAFGNDLDNAAVDDNDDDGDDDFYARNFNDPKYYVTASRPPQKLLDCVVCVGQERKKGKNVKAATDACNKKNCKKNTRSIFDTRSLEAQELAGLLEAIAEEIAENGNEDK